MRMPQLKVKVAGFAMIGCGLACWMLLRLHRTNLETRREAARTAEIELAAAHAGTMSEVARGFLHILRPLLARLRTGNELSPYEIFVMRNTVDAWLAADAASCFAFFAAIDNLGICTNHTSIEAAIDSAPKDFAAFLEYTRGLSDPRVSEPLLQSCVERAAEKDPIEALGLIKSLPRHLQKQMQRRVAEIWIKRDVGRALEYLVQSPECELAAFRSACAFSAHVDPVKSFQTLLALPDAAFAGRPRFFSKKNALEELLMEVRNSDLDLAISLVTQLPDSDFRWKNLRYLTILSIERGAASESSDFVHDGYTARIIRDAAWNIAGQDPDRAAKLADFIPGELARTNAYLGIVQTTASKSPQDAVEWAGRINEPITRSEAVNAAFDIWLKKQPEKAILYALQIQSQDSDLAELARLQVLDFAYETDPKVQAELAANFQGLSSPIRIALKAGIAAKYDAETANRILKLLP